MSYLHIKNLYADTRILEFKNVYSLEKIHGSSSNVKWQDGKLSFFSGGEKHETFVNCFNPWLLEKLNEKFTGYTETVTIFGEVYAGRCQGMSKTYGPDLKFVAFDVRIGDNWLSVPQAHDLVTSLGLEFVDYTLVSTDLEVLNSERDKPSVQAVRNGIIEPRKKEGIVLRPPFEVTLNNGERLIAKHKNQIFRETKTPREVDPNQKIILETAQAAADEYVTPGRMSNARTHFTENHWVISNLGNIIKYIIEDIFRESCGEVIDSKEIRKALASKTAILFKQMYCTI